MSHSARHWTCNGMCNRTAIKRIITPSHLRCENGRHEWKVKEETGSLFIVSRGTNCLGHSVGPIIGRQNPRIMDLCDWNEKEYSLKPRNPSPQHHSAPPDSPNFSRPERIYVTPKHGTQDSVHKSEYVWLFLNSSSFTMCNCLTAPAVDSDYNLVFSVYYWMANVCSKWGQIWCTDENVCTVLSSWSA